jgi:hypothetical protein
VPPATQQFIVGVYNQDPTHTVYVQIEIRGSGDDGSHTFAVKSVIFAIAPRQFSPSVNLYVTFTARDLGLTYTFTAVIHWGTTPDSLGGTSTSVSKTGQEDFDTSNSPAGSFTIVP